MRYIITDTQCKIQNENIMKYFQDELQKTNLERKDISVETSLQKKLGNIELKRIFNENFAKEQTKIENGYIHLTHSGNIIKISCNEIKDRFYDLFDREINYHTHTISNK